MLYCPLSLSCVLLSSLTSCPSLVFGDISEICIVLQAPCCLLGIAIAISRWANGGRRERTPRICTKPAFVLSLRRRRFLLFSSVLLLLLLCWANLCYVAAVESCSRPEQRGTWRGSDRGHRYLVHWSLAYREGSPLRTLSPSFSLAIPLFSLHSSLAPALSPSLRM